MIYRMLLAALCVVCFSVESKARQRTYAAHPDCNVTMPCEGVSPSPRGEMVRKALGGLGSARPVYAPRRSESWTFVKMKKSAESFGLPPNLKEKLTGSRRSVVRDSLTAGDGRPAGCPARAWCGCWLAAHLGISNRSLWLARNWASVGHPAGGPQPGAIVVWRHHVGTIKAVEGSRILVLSGNDGRAVRERWRTTAGVIAYRVPG